MMVSDDVDEVVIIVLQSSQDVDFDRIDDRFKIVMLSCTCEAREPV